MTEERSDADVLEMERDIRAAPERVFRALTEPEELLEWWGKRGTMIRAENERRPGGRYRFEFRLPDGGTAVLTGEYRVFDPPRRIVKTWNNSMFPDVPNVVEFSLEPIPGGTRLKLRHSGLAATPAARADYENGWIGVFGQLIAWLAIVAATAAASQAASSD